MGAHDRYDTAANPGAGPDAIRAVVTEALANIDSGRLGGQALLHEQDIVNVAAANASTPPDLLQSLAREPGARWRLAANDAVGPDLLHRIITDSEKEGDDDYRAEVFVGMHPNARPETLESIANLLESSRPDDTDLAADLGPYSNFAEWDGPVQAFVAILCHRSTPHATRTQVRRRLNAALLRCRAGSHLDPTLVNNIRELIDYHKDLDHSEGERVLLWLSGQEMT